MAVYGGRWETVRNLGGCDALLNWHDAALICGSGLRRKSESTCVTVPVGKCDAAMHTGARR